MGLGDLSPQGSVVLGIFVGLLSTSVQSLGLTLQRKSHILEEEKEHLDTRRPPYRRRRWQLGMFMFVVSNLVGSTIQITTLPLPVLSTLQASGLVFNSICASLILGEAFTRFSLVGTVLVCAGALLIAIFGAFSQPAHSLRELLDLLARTQFIGWMVGQAALVIAVLSLAKISKVLNPYNKGTPRMLLLRGMSYGGVSGILSAHSLLVAKSAVELVVKSVVDKDNQFNRWQSWMILLWLLALALTQLYYLHRGLKLVSTSILYPFVFCVYNIIAILDGLIYFDQTSLVSVLDGCLIALGTVILLSGVICLSWRLSQDRESAKTPTIQTPLTPGLGIVGSPTPPSTPHSPSSEDLESGPLLGVHRSQTLPAQHSQHYGTTDTSPSRSQTPSQGKRSVHYAADTLRQSEDKPRTPSPRLARFRTRRAAEEIWDELEEDSPPLPFARRYSLGLQSRAGLPPSRLHAATTGTGSAGGHTRGVSLGTGLAMSSSGDLPSLDEEHPGETGVLQRSGTGRSYRRRRRESHESREGRDWTRDESGDRQAAQGGWWRMRRWWRNTSREPGLKGKGKGRARSEDKDRDRGRGFGGGDEGGD